MNGVLARWGGPLYAILRIMAGLMFMMHGTQKILGLPPRQGGGPAVASLPWIAGVLELVLGALTVVGFLTGVAAFIASGLMAAAYFIAHAPQGFFPIANRGELAAVYCFLFLFMAAYGSGPFSVDAALRRRR